MARSSPKSTRASGYKREDLSLLSPKALNAIGKQGKPRDEATALAQVNKPRFDASELPRNKKPTKQEQDEYEKWHWNCQRCVIAYELQRRGFDVEALPFDGTYGGWNTAFEGMKRVDVGVKQRSQMLKSIYNQMQAWVVGARAILGVTWGRKRDGHVVSVEMLPNGKMKIVDPQNGKPINWNFYRANASPGKLRLWRVDDKRIAHASALVKQRGT